MFPKAYIFYTIPNGKLYIQVRTSKTSNVSLNDYNPYLKHNLDVKQMWDVACFQHPQSLFSHVLVVPSIDLKNLTYAHMVKNHEAIYCLYAQDDLEKLTSISDDIAAYGPDYSRIDVKGNSIHMHASNQAECDMIHDAIHENFISLRLRV